MISTVHFGWLGNGRRRPAKMPKKAVDGDVGQWTTTLGSGRRLWAVDGDVGLDGDFGLDGNFGVAGNGLGGDAGQ
jgi:hypothetical protein